MRMRIFNLVILSPLSAHTDIIRPVDTKNTIISQTSVNLDDAAPRACAYKLAEIIFFEEEKYICY